MLPYQLAMCTEKSVCQMNEYKDYAFDQQDYILSLTDTSQKKFIDLWSNQVAFKFDSSASDLANIYSTNDTYNTNTNTRVFWKYAVSKNVSGTPTAFVNGVKLDTMPATVDEWIELLNDVYASQYKPYLRHLGGMHINQ